MVFCGITSSRPEWLITGNFGLKFSPNAFEILSTRSSHRRISAPWALFSKKSESDSTQWQGRRAAPSGRRDAAFPTLRYLHGPGTGITNLPSFSATKFSLVLDELPLPSFFSTLIMSFFVGLRFRQTLPVGPSIGVVAFLTSSGVRL